MSIYNNRVIGNCRSEEENRSMVGFSMTSINLAVIIISVFLAFLLDWLLIKWLKKMEMSNRIKDLIGKGGI